MERVHRIARRIAGRIALSGALRIATGFSASFDLLINFYWQSEEEQAGFRMRWLATFQLSI